MIKDAKEKRQNKWTDQIKPSRLISFGVFGFETLNQPPFRLDFGFELHLNLLFSLASYTVAISLIRVSFPTI